MSWHISSSFKIKSNLNHRICKHQMLRHGLQSTLHWMTIQNLLMNFRVAVSCSNIILLLKLEQSCMNLSGFQIILDRTLPSPQHVLYRSFFAIQEFKKSTQRKLKEFLNDITHPFLNRFMLTTILCCCHRFEKLITPSLKKSWLPIWTKVKSCSTRPLQSKMDNFVRTIFWVTIVQLIIITCMVCRADWFQQAPGDKHGNLNWNR